MNKTIIQTLWDTVRPYHAPFTRSLRRRLGRNYFEHPEMVLPKAYESVQIEVERRLHHYLHVPSNQIEQIVIVGANDGTEIPRLRKSYQNSRFLCFEPSPVWHKKLEDQFGGLEFIETRNLALSDQAGKATFHELPLSGNGSLLPPDKERWSAFNRMEKSEVTALEVQVSTLDAEASGLDRINLLWMDVQGAEGHVLRGGTQTLPRTESIFLEVTLVESPYRGASVFSQVDQMLRHSGFTCVGLGTDSWNYTGNALWIRNIDQRVALSVT